MPIGTVWAAGTWADDCWGDGTWGDAAEAPPTTPARDPAPFGATARTGRYAPRPAPTPAPPYAATERTAPYG